MFGMQPQMHMPNMQHPGTMPIQQPQQSGGCLPDGGQIQLPWLTSLLSFKRCNRNYHDAIEGAKDNTDWTIAKQIEDDLCVALLKSIEVNCEDSWSLMHVTDSKNYVLHLLSSIVRS